MSAPKFAGMSGNMLSRAVTATATMGFLLFGYDRRSGCFPLDDLKTDFSQRVS